MEATSLIEQILILGLPFLDAEAANKEIIRLTAENMRLQAEIDAMKNFIVGAA